MSSVLRIGTVGPWIACDEMAQWWRVYTNNWVALGARNWYTTVSGRVWRGKHHNKPWNKSLHRQRTQASEGARMMQRSKKTFKNSFAVVQSGTDTRVLQCPVDAAIPPWERYLTSKATFRRRSRISFESYLKKSPSYFANLREAVPQSFT